MNRNFRDDVLYVSNAEDGNIDGYELHDDGR